MWCRVVEIMVGIWLAMSPFIFRHPDSNTWWWGVDWGASLCVVLFGFLSFYHPLRQTHLLTVIVGLALMAFGYLAEDYPAPPAMQNEIIVGLTLVMVAILPNHASRPPLGWEHYHWDDAQRSELTGR